MRGKRYGFAKRAGNRKKASIMTTNYFPYIRVKVIRANRLKHLFGQLDDEPRPFELVVHPPIAGTRPVTIKAGSEEDAEYFKGILDKLSDEPVDRLAYEPDTVKP